MYKGIIFDFNGTLFWDTHLHNEAWDIFLNQFDIQLSKEEKHLKLHGKNNIQLIKDLINPDLSIEEIRDIAKRKELLYQDLVKKENLYLADGAVHMFEQLIRYHIPFTIVTASDKLNVDFFVDYLELKRWFDIDKIVFADGIIKPKPCPDMFLKAMDLLKINPHETVIFEDSETGLRAATAAKPGKIIIVDSTGAEYSHWGYEIIRSIGEIDVAKFINQMKM